MSDIYLSYGIYVVPLLKRSDLGAGGGLPCVLPNAAVSKLGKLEVLLRFTGCTNCARPIKALLYSSVRAARHQRIQSRDHCL